MQDPSTELQYQDSWFSLILGKGINNLHAKVPQGQISVQVSGAGSNEVVPGVPFFSLSAGSPVLFTPLINLSQPTIRSSPLGSKCQNMCRTAHEGVIFVLQNELEVPMVSLCPMQNFRERITVLRCVTPSIYVCPRWVQFARAN